jgi:hypothetical protein
MAAATPQKQMVRRPSPNDDPVIAVYREQVDCSILKANLRLTISQRAEKFLRQMQLIYELRAAGERQRAQAPRGSVR